MIIIIIILIIIIIITDNKDNANNNNIIYINISATVTGIGSTCKGVAPCSLFLPNVCSNLASENL